MEQGLTTKPTLTEVEEQKQKTWGLFGLGIYRTELSLIQSAGMVCNNLSVLPKNIYEVPDAEKRLADGKKEQKAIETKRKEITTKLDELTSRLMVSEKSITPAINQLSTEIIRLKKEDEEKQRKAKATSDELVRCKEFCQNEAIRIDTMLKNKVLDLVSRCYNKALETNINPTEINAFIEQSKGAVTSLSFPYDTPVFHEVNITQEQVTTIAKEHFVINVENYINDFKKQVDEKFSDYDVAFHNKAQALANSQKEEQDKKQDIAQQAQQQQVSNKIEASSVTSTEAQFYTKALKKSYAVDMDETMENALAIIAAFSANLHLCKQHIKISKWFGFSATQAGNALAKVKCEDNAFNPIGITFKEVEKL